MAYKRAAQYRVAFKFLNFKRHSRRQSSLRPFGVLAEILMRKPIHSRSKTPIMWVNPAPTKSGLGAAAPASRVYIQGERSDLRPNFLDSLTLIRIFYSLLGSGITQNWDTTELPRNVKKK